MGQSAPTPDIAEESELQQQQLQEREQNQKLQTEQLQAVLGRLRGGGSNGNNGSTSG